MRPAMTHPDAPISPAARCGAWGRIAFFAAFTFTGAYFGAGGIALRNPDLRDPQGGINSEARELLQVPGFADDLTARMRGVPAGESLFIVDTAGHWMSSELAMLAGVVLAPRPVILALPENIRDPATPRPGAILFFQTEPFPGLAGERQPFGPDATLVVLGGAPHEP
jgi:hypothetical protein